MTLKIANLLISEACLCFFFTRSEKTGEQKSVYSPIEVQKPERITYGYTMTASKELGSLALDEGRLMRFRFRSLWFDEIRKVLPTYMWNSGCEWTCGRAGPNCVQRRDQFRPVPTSSISRETREMRSLEASIISIVGPSIFGRKTCRIIRKCAQRCDTLLLECDRCSIWRRGAVRGGDSKSNYVLLIIALVSDRWVTHSYVVCSSFLKKTKFRSW